jgi:hypothetical protein
MLFFYLWNQWQGSPLTGSLLLWKDKVLKSAGVQLDDTGLDGSSETANTTKPRGVKPCWLLHVAPDGRVKPYTTSSVSSSEKRKLPQISTRHQCMASKKISTLHWIGLVQIGKRGKA